MLLLILKVNKLTMKGKNNQSSTYDAVVIGGGIFGVYAAYLLSRKKVKTLIVEKEHDILSRASKVNQARVHRGYHYPRCQLTAKKVAKYYDLFCEDFKEAVIKKFDKYYAVASQNSKVSANEYIQFCDELCLPYKKIKSSRYFKKGVVDVVLKVNEKYFDYKILTKLFKKKIKKNLIDIEKNTDVVKCRVVNNKYHLTLDNGKKICTSAVINATYSSINKVNKLFGFSEYEIKYELCELKLGKVNSKYKNIGITVMDGPFFSIMPYGDGTYHSLSSVVHTPLHTSYKEAQDLAEAKKIKTNGEMISLVKKYLSKNIGFEYKKSIYEVKPIIVAAEDSDSRPTIITTHSTNPYFISVLSGKISSIYDLEYEMEHLISVL